MTLQALPGQIITPEGPTGAGKAMLINLPMRIYEIDNGNISIDGEDIRDIRKAGLLDLWSYDALRRACFTDRRENDLIQLIRIRS